MSTILADSFRRADWSLSVGWPESLGLLMPMVPRRNTGAVGKVFLMFWVVINSLGPRGGGEDLVSYGRTLHGSK